MKKVFNFGIVAALLLSMTNVQAQSIGGTIKSKATDLLKGKTKVGTTTNTNTNTSGTSTTTTNGTTTTTNPLGSVTGALGNVLGSGLSESDIAKGLTEALKVGSRNASQQLSLADGFNKNLQVRIPFPEDAQRVATKLRAMGMGKKIDEFEKTLNRAAEKAAPEAANIFVSAIEQLTIADASNILQGQNNAATQYLQGKTTDNLYAAFYPHINSTLKSVGATSRWTDITKIYNKLPLVKKVETDLAKYTTNKALKGMFTVVANEELKIRQDPKARINDILETVFGKK